MTLPSMVLVRAFLSNSQFYRLCDAQIRIANRDGRKQQDLIHNHEQDVPADEVEDRERMNSVGWNLVDSGKARITFNPPEEESGDADPTKATTASLLHQDLINAGYKLVDVYILRRPGEQPNQGLLVARYVPNDHEDPPLEEDGKLWAEVSRIFAQHYYSAYVYDNPDNTMSVDVAGVVHRKTSPSIFAVRQRRELRACIGKSGGLTWRNNLLRRKILPPVGIQTVTLSFQLFAGNAQHGADAPLLKKLGVAVAPQAPSLTGEAQHYGHPDAIPEDVQYWEGVTLTPHRLIEDLRLHGYVISNFQVLEGDDARLLVTLSFHGVRITLEESLDKHLREHVLPELHLYACVVTEGDQILVSYGGRMPSGKGLRKSKMEAILKRHHLRVSPNNGLLVRVPGMGNIKQMQRLRGLPPVRCWVQSFGNADPVDLAQIYRFGLEAGKANQNVTPVHFHDSPELGCDTLVLIQDAEQVPLSSKAMAEHIVANYDGSPNTLELDLETLTVTTVLS